MNWLRRSVVAAAIAGLVVLGLVAVSSPASATEPRPVDQRIATLDDAKQYLPNDAYNQLIANLNNADCVNNGCEQTEFPLLESLVAKVGGTPESVQLGTKIASRGCKTGYGCLGALAAALGIGIVGYGTSETWIPWVQGELDSLGSLGGAQPVYYSSERPEKIVVGIAATGVSSSNQNIVVTSTARVFAACRYGCNIKNRIAVDFVHKTTGVWQHWSLDQTKGWTYAGAEMGYNLMHLNTQGYSSATHEIRRIHFSERVADNPTATVYGLDQGWYWGQEIVPTSGSIESLTRCSDGVGGVYDVVGTEPIATGLSPIKACQPGDTPIYQETTTISPDGTRQLQSSQKLDNTAEAESTFPACAGTGCIWSVKVNGQPCADGQAGCVQWATDKASATCWYGPYQMPLSQCYWLERAYEFGGVQVPATIPNTDGNPATWDGPVPQLQPSTAPSPSPTATSSTAPSPTSTGSPVPTPTPSASPSASPSTTSTTSTAPSATPSPSSTSDPSPVPSSGPGTSGSPDPADAESSACWPSGWGWFQPDEWVLKPIRCAFIPSPATVTAVRTQVGTSVSTSGAGPILDVVSVPFDEMSSGSGCEGIVFDLPIGGQSFHGSILNACSGPMATAAHVANALVSLSVILAGGMSLLRLAGAGFGYNVRPNDGD